MAAPARGRSGRPDPLLPNDSRRATHHYHGVLPAGRTPAAFITGVPGISTATAAALSSMVWFQTASGVLDANNYDLDADRGPQHPCWVAQGSINDNPVDVANLDYTDT